MMNEGYERLEMHLLWNKKCRLSRQKNAENSLEAITQEQYQRHYDR
jgi:hypothetical protein